MATSREEMLRKVRERMLKKEKGGSSYTPDPAEFKAPKVDFKKSKSLKFIVLPPLEVGETCATGENKTDMENIWSYRIGTHWINNRPYSCPRIFNNEKCPYCNLGFSLLEDEADEDRRREIAKLYLPRVTHATNVYFPPYESNPEDLRGKVKWYNITQKTVYKKMTDTFMRNEEDATGDTPEETKAFGFFYLPDESYVFNMKITHKGGYNNYDLSDFLPSTKGPIADTQDEINRILSQRHDLGSKFTEPNVEVLQDLANKAQGLVTEEGGSSDNGFDEEESTPTTKSVDTEKIVASVAASASSDSTVDDDDIDAIIDSL